MWILSILILFGLLAAPGAASKAASDAALLWWTRVLPSLLPYLVASSLLMRSGVLLRLPKRLKSFLLLPLGLLGGYPVGAKLAGRLLREGAVSHADAQRIAEICSFPNPVFLISVVAAGLFSDPRAAIPLLLGVCGTSAFALIPLSRIRFSDVRAAEPPAFPRDLPASISDGVSAILNIGGCLIFASVLGALIETTGFFHLFGAGADIARAVVLGLCEMTSGASLAASLPLSLPLRLALCAFFLQFGGVSVLLQSASQLPLSLKRYGLVRLFIALVSAVAVLLLTPLFCPDVPVPTMASSAEMLRNTFDLLAVSLSSAFGLLLVFVFTFGLSKGKRGV